MPHSAQWLQRIDDEDVIRLAHVMEAAKWSFYQTAKRLDVHPMTIAFWTTNRTRPNPTNRARLRTFLNSVANSFANAP